MQNSILRRLRSSVKSTAGASLGFSCSLPACAVLRMAVSCCSHPHRRSYPPGLTHMCPWQFAGDGNIELLTDTAQVSEDCWESRVGQSGAARLHKARRPWHASRILTPSWPYLAGRKSRCFRMASSARSRYFSAMGETTLTSPPMPRERSKGQCAMKSRRRPLVWKLRYGSCVSHSNPAIVKGFSSG